MEHADNKNVDVYGYFGGGTDEEWFPAILSPRQPTRPQPTGCIAAIEHAILVQNWDEARRLASREDSGDEI